MSEAVGARAPLAYQREHPPLVARPLGREGDDLPVTTTTEPRPAESPVAWFLRFAADQTIAAISATEKFLTAGVQNVEARLLPEEHAALAVVRNALPGDEAKAAFDSAVVLAVERGLPALNGYVDNALSIALANALGSLESHKNAIAARLGGGVASDGAPAVNVPAIKAEVVAAVTTHLEAALADHKDAVETLVDAKIAEATDSIDEKVATAAATIPDAVAKAVAELPPPAATTTS